MPFCDQGLYVRFEAGEILTRMLENHLDQASFAGPKVPMNAAARQAMQDRNRLLNEQLFEFVDGHSGLRKALNVRREAMNAAVTFS